MFGEYGADSPVVKLRVSAAELARWKAAATRRDSKLRATWRRAEGISGLIPRRRRSRDQTGRQKRPRGRPWPQAAIAPCGHTPPAGQRKALTMFTDNDRRLLQLLADDAGGPDYFELRLVARSLLAVEAELRELRGRTELAAPANRAW